MKIAIIGSRGYPYVYSGYETFVKELAERLVKLEVDVTVYCHKGLFNSRPSTINGINLKYIPSIETKILSQLSHSFLSVLNACISRYDIVLMVNSANGPFGLLTRLFRIKTAINVDGLEWLRPKWKGLGAKYFYFASYLSTKLYDQIINDSEEMKRIYLDLFKTDSIVIAYGANIRYSKQPELIRKWNLVPDEYFLIVGRMIPDNNADVLVRGFLKTNTNKKLVIVGDVPYKDKYASELRKIGEKDNRIIFTGYVTNQDELAELYHNSFVYLHGHEFGGTNPTMLKAMAYGCAILALDTAFNREMLQNGTYGLFFNKTIDSVTNSLTQIASNEQLVLEMKANARNGITEKYKWDYVTNQYMDVFENITTQNI